MSEYLHHVAYHTLLIMPTTGMEDTVKEYQEWSNEIVMESRIYSTALSMLAFTFGDKCENIML